MRAIEWWKCPNDFTLSTSDGWEELGYNRYRAVRNHYLIIQNKSTHAKTGPIILESKLPSGAEIRFDKKYSIVAKNARLISTTIQNTITTKLLSEIGIQLGSETSLMPPFLKTHNQVLSKLTSEFTETISATLSETRSYEVTSTHELMSSFSLRVPDGEPNRKNTYYFYLPVWLWQWDVYLFRQEIVEFTHKRNQVFWRNREGIRAVVNDIRMPLARIVFYEPDEGPSVDSESFEPEVPDAHVITILPLSEPCPTSIKLMSQPLESFLAIAFPTTKKERESSSKVRLKAKKVERESVGLFSEEWVSLKRTSKKLPLSPKAGKRRELNVKVKRKSQNIKINSTTSRTKRRNPVKE